MNKNTATSRHPANVSTKIQMRHRFDDKPPIFNESADFLDSPQDVTVKRLVVIHLKFGTLDAPSCLPVSGPTNQGPQGADSFHSFQDRRWIMRRASYFLAAVVLAGLVTTTALGSEPHSRRSLDDRASIQTVAHPGMPSRHGSYHNHHPYGRHGYSHGYHHSRRPIVVYPPYYGGGYGPIYPSYPHRCGPHCGPRCGYVYPPNNFYYRGSGLGFSFSF